MNETTTTVTSETSTSVAIGQFLLRLTIAGLMLFHGIDKVVNGIDGISGMLEKNNLPTIFAYGVYIGELVVPVLIIIGLLTRISAIIFAFNMVVAIGLAHVGDLFSLGPHGGYAIEVQMLYLLGSICILFLGPGKFSIDAKLWNR
jgi:putative oxidoreductase